MTIFDHINSIIYSKKKIELNCDDESQFSLYMVNRWISFYSPELCNYVNATANLNSNVFNNKQEQYDYLYNVMPKLRFKKIDYIKKVKKEEDKEEEKLHIPEFMSKAEFMNNLELLKQLGK